MSSILPFLYLSSSGERRGGVITVSISLQHEITLVVQHSRALASVGYRWHNESMDRDDKLANSNLFKSLNATCAMFAAILESETKEITADQIARMPDWVFNVAVHAGWIPEPDRRWQILNPDPDYENLGHWAVRRTYRDDFLALLEVLKEIEPINEEYWRRVHEEDKKQREKELQIENLLIDAEWIKERCEALGLTSPISMQNPDQTTKPTAIQIMERSGYTVEQLSEMSGVSVATIYRIRSGQLAYSRHRESLKALASVLECDWQDLLPHKP
jgi:transcriptional regulator with XRE-family HTH domain